MQQPAVADLVKRISQDLQGKSSSAEVTFRKGANELRHKHAKAMFSYTPDNDDELRLEKDDMVEILGEEEEGWWRGRLLKAKDKEGVFPNNFVKLIDDSDSIISKSEEKIKSAEQDSSAPTTQQEMIQPKKIQGIGFGNIFAGENKIELRRSCLGDTKKLDATSAKDGKTMSNGRTTELSQKSQEYAKVAFPYEAENEDELTLKEGDVILILSKKCEDPGWWRGELNGREGVFPDNFVELLSAEEVERFKKSGGAALVSPPIIPAKPTKLVGPVRPVSPPATATTTTSSSSSSSEPHQTTTTTAPTKHAPERPLPPAQPPAKILATGTGKTISPSSSEQKDKSPTGSETEKTSDNKPSTPKKIFTASLSNLIAKGRPPAPGQQTAAAFVTPPSSLDEKSIHKNVDERDAVAPLDSERLTHPTALRPRNPNKRPPSQAFLKDSIAPTADSPTYPDLSALSSINNDRSCQTTQKEKVMTSQISNDRKAIENLYVTKEEFDNLKNEFDQFRKEYADKMQTLEELLSCRNSNK